MVISFLSVISWYCYIIRVSCVPLYWSQKCRKIASIICIRLLLCIVIFLPHSYGCHVSISIAYARKNIFVCKKQLNFRGAVSFLEFVIFYRSVYTLVTGKRKELPILAKYLEGFLDDGPQFVLRLIVFVLYGLGREGLDKGR